MRSLRETLAAFIVEPLVQGAAGMLMMPEGYLARVRAITKECGVLLICDEVATGFGRTGTLFACNQEGVNPDIMAVAKGLTGGYLPLAATLTTEEVYRAFLGGTKNLRRSFTATPIPRTRWAARPHWPPFPSSKKKTCWAASPPFPG